MSIQIITGILLAALAFASFGYNYGLWLQTEQLGRLYWAALSFAGVEAFVASCIKKTAPYKFIQVVFIALVAALVMRYNEEPLIGAFFMLGNMALAYSYGFYDRLPIVGALISIASIFTPLLITYQNFQKAILTTTAIFITLFVVFLIIRNHQKSDRKRLKELENIATEAFDLLEKYEQNKGCQDANTR